MYKKALKLVQGDFARVQKGIEVSSRGVARVQKGLEVTSSRFCAVYNLGLKLLHANLRTF